jgi:hypothetical protein
VVCRDEGAHIHYTWEPGRADANSIVIVCNPRLYRPDTVCKLHVRGQVKIWGETGAADELDVIGGACRLLALQDEWHVPAEARDRRGTFVTSGRRSQRSRMTWNRFLVPSRSVDPQCEDPPLASNVRFDATYLACMRGGSV